MDNQGCLSSLMLQQSGEPWQRSVPSPVALAQLGKVVITSDQCWSPLWWKTSQYTPRSHFHFPGLGTSGLLLFLPVWGQLNVSVLFTVRQRWRAGAGIQGLNNLSFCSILNPFKLEKSNQDRLFPLLLNHPFAALTSLWQMEEHIHKYVCRSRWNIYVARRAHTQ